MFGASTGDVDWGRLLVAIRDRPAKITFGISRYFGVTVDHLAGSALRSSSDIVLLSRDVGEGPSSDSCSAANTILYSITSSARARKHPLVSHPRNDAMRLIKFEPGTVFGEKPQRRYSQGPLRRIAKVTTPMVR
jgi:hypothetical protein